MNMKRKNALVALLLIGSVSAMNQENYSESDVRSMLRTISQQINFVRQDYAEQMQTLKDQHQAEVDQLKQSLNDVKEALAQANRRLEMVDERVASELLRLRHDSNVVEYLVAPMRSDEQDNFKATASSTYSRKMSKDSSNGLFRFHSEWTVFNSPYKAFRKADNFDDENCWKSSNRSDSNQMCRNTWIQIQLPTPKICDCIQLNHFTSKAFTIEGSNDGRSWTKLLKVEDAGSSNIPKNWNFNNTTAYSHYRMNITKTYTSNQFVSIGALDFLRR